MESKFEPDVTSGSLVFKNRKSSNESLGNLGAISILKRSNNEVFQNDAVVNYLWFALNCYSWYYVKTQSR